jgi:hypothetical protein
MTGDADTNAWLNARAPFWRALAQSVGQLRRRPNLSLAEALAAVESYRNLARALASARRLVPGTRVTSALEALYVQLHAAITRSPSGGWRGALALLRDQVPRIVRELAPRIVWMVCLMALTAGVGFWLVSS